MLFCLRLKNELYDKLKHKLKEGELLVKSSNIIAKQSINKTKCLRIGYIKNIESMNYFNIPNHNIQLYNDDERIEKDVFNGWTKNRIVVIGKRNPISKDYKWLNYDNH